MESNTLVIHSICCHLIRQCFLKVMQFEGTLVVSVSFIWLPANACRSTVFTLNDICYPVESQHLTLLLLDTAPGGQWYLWLMSLLHYGVS